MEAKVLQRCLAPFLGQGVLDHKSGWWFQIFFIFTPKIGEDFQFDEHIFQVGWNHQPEIQFMHFLQGWLVSRIFCSTGLREQILLGLGLIFVWGWKSCTWSVANVCKNKRPRGFPSRSIGWSSCSIEKYWDRFGSENRTRTSPEETDAFQLQLCNTTFLDGWHVKLVKGLGFLYSTAGLTW